MAVDIPSHLIVDIDDPETMALLENISTDALDPFEIVALIEEWLGCAIYDTKEGIDLEP